MNVDEMTDEMKEQYRIEMMFVRNRATNIRWVAKELRTPEMFELALRKNPGVLSLLSPDDRTPELCSFAVVQDPCSLRFVKKQTEALCLDAILRNPVAIGFAKKKTEKLCLAAVGQRGYAIDLIPMPTKTVCLEAVRETPSALFHIHSWCHKTFWSYEDKLEVFVEAVREAVETGKGMDFDDSIQFDWNAFHEATKIVGDTPDMEPDFRPGEYEFRECVRRIKSRRYTCKKLLRHCLYCR